MQINWTLRVIGPKERGRRKASFSRLLRTLMGSSQGSKVPEYPLNEVYGPPGFPSLTGPVLVTRRLELPTIHFLGGWLGPRRCSLSHGHVDAALCLPRLLGLLVVALTDS